MKWGKETYPDIEVNTDEPPMLFKAQLFALTGVQPERQKVMLKGVTLKDEDWKNFNLRDVSRQRKRVDGADEFGLLGDYNIAHGE